METNEIGIIVKKLALFQFKCDLLIFEEIFGNKSNALHMYKRFIELNRNLLEFTGQLDEINLSILYNYINENMKPI